MTRLPSIPTATALMLAGATMLMAGPGLAANPTAAQNVTSACSQQYQAAKTAGTLAGKTWKQYLSDCSASMKTGSQPAAAAAPAASSTTAKTGKTAAGTATASAASGHMTTQQLCSQQYQSAKTAGTLNGQKWPQFLKSCSDSIKSDQEDAQAVPPEPAAATARTAATGQTGASGKALTPGQMAFRQRIHECSEEWQQDKAAGSLPAGQKWPQFWSACNTRLKAQG